MTDPKPSGPWWHWAILAVLFLGAGVYWLIDPPVEHLGGYVLALLMLGVAASASRNAWVQIRRLPRGRGSDAEQIRWSALAPRRAGKVIKESSVVEGLRETPRPFVPEDAEWIARLTAEERAERENPQ